ncbi:ankyrin [Anaeromyces robustus]|uniref:Ankyrin n=1 Tax=Anaeromyces robustus TaxID=1754192 RepID=A0A1Y1WCA5_9FUNG|nr:ankyrin [Anaeromyces robustus]|eukprot:ORX71015.1 ankyrin [Anaeromyces robustus]
MKRYLWNYPLLKALENKNRDIFKLLINYANQNNIVLNITEKNNKGNFPILQAYECGIDIIKALINYANNHNIILNFNEKNGYGNYPLLKGVEYNMFEIAMVIIQFLKTVENNNMIMFKVLVDYANKKRLILDINGKNKENDYPLLIAFKYNNHGNYPLLNAIKKSNEDMIQLLIQYANEHKIILNLNEKDNRGNSPLLNAIKKCNEDMIKLLIQYADEHEIILNLNEKDKYGNYPLFLCY